MGCKGICKRYKAQKPVGSGRYANGQKRCQICELFIRWDGPWRPCCGYNIGRTSSFGNRLICLLYLPYPISAL
jgi:hypothetical protein